MTDSAHRCDGRSVEAVYRVIYERRDMRHFLPLPVEPAIVRRLFDAAKPVLISHVIRSARAASPRAKWR